MTFVDMGWRGLSRVMHFSIEVSGILPASSMEMKAKVKAKAITNSIFLEPRFRVRSGREIAFGPGKAKLLQHLEETGSIVAAALQMKMSYMRAWSLIQTMNACFKEPLIDAVRGGNARGGASLTATGRLVLTLYRQMERKGIKAIQTDWQELQKMLRG